MRWCGRNRCVHLPPTRKPKGKFDSPNQRKTEFSADDIDKFLSRGGPSLKDIHRDFVEVRDYLKEAALFGRELPTWVDRQSDMMNKLADVAGYLRGLSTTRVGPIPITTLAPSHYELRRDIPAVLQPVDDGFTATFFDANISASGDTEEEAVSNLRSLIVDIFVDLQSEAPARLGSEPSRQLAVLKALIRET